MSAAPSSLATMTAGTVPDGFVALDSVLPWFGDPHLDKTRRQAQRWASKVPSVQRKKHCGAWHVHTDARLPDGCQVGAYLKCGRSPELHAGQVLPPGHARWTPRDWQRYDWSLEFRNWIEETARQNKQFARGDVYRLVVERHGDKFAARKLPRSRRRIDDMLNRIDPRHESFDGNVDHRGRGTADTAAGDASCTPEAWELFTSYYLHPNKRSVKLCHEIVEYRAGQSGWTWPSLRTIQRRVRAELPPFMADYHRLGPQAWSRKHAPRIERDLVAVRPNETWVGDHTQFDFLAMHEGKPVRLWLTAWMDQRSRVVVGHVVTPRPDSDTIMQAFRDGVVENGAPLHTIIDNGKDYRSKAFSGGRRGKPLHDEKRIKSMLGRLDVGVTFCEPFNPGAKAIERFFGTLHNRFDRLFDSYCGKDPKDRPEALYERLRRRAVELPTLAEVESRLMEWFRAYHNTTHSGDAMDGKSPLWVFINCDPIPRRTAPEDVLAVLVQKTVEVKVTKNGVRYNGVQYGQANAELWKRHGEALLLRIDPARGDRVEVCDLQGRHITWATQQRLRGVSHEDIKTAKRRQKRARQLAKSARSALHDSAKRVTELAIEAQRERVQPLRKAVGAETEAPLRGVQLLPTASHVVAPPPIDDAAEAVSIDDFPDVELDFDRDDAPVTSPLDLLPDLTIGSVDDIENDADYPLDALVGVGDE